MKLNILFEDESILIVDKPTGLVVNRAKTVKEKTLQDLLSRYFRLGNSLGIGGRAGIVHRLDRETSGVIVIAKTQNSFNNMQSQFKSRSVFKKYVGLVHGTITKHNGKIDYALGRVGGFGKFGPVKEGRESITEYEVIGYFQYPEDKLQKHSNENNFTKPRVNLLKNHAREYSLVNFYPKTGRTHQIRVHAKSLGYPIVSDMIYTPKKLLKFDLLWCPRIFLHAEFIEFIHPKTNKRLSFKADLPKDLKSVILTLSKN